MDGARIHDLLEKEGVAKGGGKTVAWEGMDGHNLKHAIHKKYTGSKLTPVGQTISVMLPFTDELRDEPLCNVDHVIKVAGTLGFKLDLRDSFSAYVDKFAESNGVVARNLTDLDKKYIDLHTIVCLRKMTALK
jgi:hypothetical protein